MMEDAFMNAQEAQLILQRYRLGESTPAETQLVEAWYQRLVDTGEWQWGEGEKEALETAIKVQLLQQIKPQPVVAHRVHFLKTSWFRYAAAVVLIAGGAAIWWEISRTISPLSSRDREISAATAKDIAPGGNKAVLTLADGSTIVLDNAANGNLAQQGNTKVIKLDNGQLAYNAGKDLNKEVFYNTISTPRGGQYQIVLPDGSKVWLNAASSIKFPAAFSGTERNVTVSGEVYMEIAKNSKQPFIVKSADGTEVRVLGTSFNINAYQDEEVIRTTLIEGSIKVIKGSSASLLKPGQEAVVTHDAELTTQSADIEQTLAWKNGSFNFNLTDIRTVMRQLSRWYDVEVVYQGGVVPNVKIGGEMQRDLTLSQVLKILEKIGLHFTIEGKKLIVKP